VTRYDAGAARRPAWPDRVRYDAHGRQSRLTDARNGATTYDYNTADQVRAVAAPGASGGVELTVSTFDNLGRLISRQEPDGSSVPFKYFPTGLLKAAAGSRTYPVEYTYDAQGRLRPWHGAELRGLGVVHYKLVGFGSATTRWNYDSRRGWLKSKDYPDKDSGLPPSTEGAGGPVFTYTPGGRLHTRAWLRPGTDSNRIVTTYTYGFNDGPADNEHGDLVNIQYSANDPAATPSLSFTYDRRGRRAQVTQGGITTTLAYNDADQPLGEAYSGGLLNGLSVTVGYNSHLQRASLALGGTGSYLVAYDYDTASRLVNLSQGDSLIGYSYLVNSPLVGQIMFTNNGSLRMTTTKQYDRVNRLESISSAALGAQAPRLPLSHAYTYNTANQRIRHVADGSYWLYTYDGWGR
jgi:YD repeat-containing protein